MLQLTTLRTADRSRFEAPMVVANASHADEIERQLARIGCAAPVLLLEPVARNTAPAIAIAALALPSDAVMLVMPSDQVIGDPEAFGRAIDTATPLVGDGWLVTFGVTPDGPETGYGYIRNGVAIADGAHKVDRFVEKPDRATAQSYLDEGGYAWNGGIFMFRASTFLDALRSEAPDIFEAAVATMAGVPRSHGRIMPSADLFGACRSESIDYAVMERSDRVAVVPVEMDWSDVGSWDALHDISSKDEEGNAHKGDIVAVRTSGCMIRSEGPLVAAVGVSDLIIVATGDAVLVMRRGDSQDVKHAIEALKAKGHVTLDRPFSLAVD